MKASLEFDPQFNVWQQNLLLDVKLSFSYYVGVKLTNTCGTFVVLQTWSKGSPQNL
jgi:hypothetical protein